MNQKQKDFYCIIPFIISGLIVFAFLSFAPLTHDDLNAYHDLAKDMSLSDMWIHVYERFFTWSSRIIIEFVLFIFEKIPKPIWAFSMGAFWSLMLFVFSRFLNNKSIIGSVFLALLSLLFPFEILGTAGWIATVHTYLTPFVFGIICLLPFKKLYNDETPISEEINEIGKARKAVSILGYTLATIYASNLEQVAVVLVFAYSVAAICELIEKRRVDFLHLWILFVSAFGLLVAFVCPGNKARTASNWGYWFPNYGMFSFGDKLELGITTEVTWLLRENNFFWLIVVIALTVLAWKNSKNTIVRVISLCPLVITALFKISVAMGEGAPSFLLDVTAKIPRNGLVNPENALSKSSFVEWVLIGVFLLSLVLLVAVAANEKRSIIKYETLLFAGIGSRWMMGFSPTLYASNLRTCTIMGLLLIMIGTMAFSELEIIYNKESTKKPGSKVWLVYLVMIVLVICNLKIFTNAIGA